MEPTENPAEPAEHDQADACTQRDGWAGSPRPRHSRPDEGVDVGWADRAGRPWTAQGKQQVDSNAARNLTQAASGEWFVLVAHTVVQPEHELRARGVVDRA
jgi:hypothetical protein